MTAQRLLNYLLPAIVAVVVLGFWEWIVWYREIKPFVLPAPSAIAMSALTYWEPLLEAGLVTLRVTAEAFINALVLAVAAATLFSQSRIVERAFMPYAVALQVTPIIAIAPLVLIWVGVDDAERAVLVLATIVAFFPILANTLLGLRSVDRQLNELFDLYGASRWQKLVRLQFPAALPFILAGMRISGGLALVAAIGAELIAGSGTATGLGWTILEAGNRLDIARMFAALVLLSAIGVGIYALLGALQRYALKNWHESERPAE